jgi:molybdopterin-containing oxidoreductase family iron-sulfur binding subunit
MVYNRCVGTRFCSNNCPYKVRRFNWFDYNAHLSETERMAKNPDVTVRERGVMEKCTFCVQRIQEAKIAQLVKAGASNDVRIEKDAFQVACQQVCAAEAIVFGDISNKDSKVSKLRELQQGYRLLEYLNVSSRVTYLARLRNPNPSMPDAATKDGAFEKKLIPEPEKKPGESKAAKHGGEA